MKFLISLNWTLWSALLMLILYGLFLIVTARTRSPEAGPALGVFLIGVALLFSAGCAALLNRFAQKHSFTGLIFMTLVLAWPLVPLIARPIMAFKDWKHARENVPTKAVPTP